MHAVRVRHHVSRAADFFIGMESTREHGGCGNSSALLAIHSALSDSDALRVGLGDAELASEYHRKAVKALEKVLPSRTDTSGISHLRALIGEKSAVAYGNQRIDVSALGNLVVKAERFATWANQTAQNRGVAAWR